MLKYRSTPKKGQFPVFSGDLTPVFPFLQLLSIRKHKNRYSFIDNMSLALIKILYLLIKQVGKGITINFSGTFLSVIVSKLILWGICACVAVSIKYQG